MLSPEPEPGASTARNAIRGGRWDQALVTQLRIMGFSNNDPGFDEPVPPEEAMAEPPLSVGALFSFGVVADVQYADLDNGSNFLKTVTRYYRHSLEALRMAVQCWSESKVHFVAQLGDLLDGQNAPDGTASAEAAVMGVLGALPPTVPVYSCVGNHELYNWQRGGPLEGSSIGVVPAPTTSAAGAATTYYSFVPHAGWRFVVLDAFVISIMGYQPEHANSIAAWALLDANNPNDCRQRGIDLSQGMTGVASRWMPYNGAHGEEQLAWLNRELQAAKQRGEKVVVLSHAGVAPGVCDDDTLAWDYDRVLATIHADGLHGVVVAFLTGHDHKGGYTTTTAASVPSSAAAHGGGGAGGGGGGDGGTASISNKIHHLTFRAPLETAPPDPCHAVVEVHEHALVCWGYGRQQSFLLEFGS